MENQPVQPQTDPQKRILEALKKTNPGQELWFGRHPKTGDFWFYRPARKDEARIYRKMQAEQKAAGELGDMELAWVMLAEACVVYPPLKEPLPPDVDPTQDTLPKLLARRSMLPSIIAGEICEVSGFTVEAEQKKL